MRKSPQRSFTIHRMMHRFLRLRAQSEWVCSGLPGTRNPSCWRCPGLAARGSGAWRRTAAVERQRAVSPEAPNPAQVCGGSCWNSISYLCGLVRAKAGDPRRPRRCADGSPRCDSVGHELALVEAEARKQCSQRLCLVAHLKAAKADLCGRMRSAKMMIRRSQWLLNVRMEDRGQPTSVTQALQADLRGRDFDGA